MVLASSRSIPLTSCHSVAAPLHAFAKIRLKIAAPAIDGTARIEVVAGWEVAKPSVGLSLKTSSPTGLAGINRIIAAGRQKVKPRWRVSFLQAAVRIGERMRLGWIECPQRTG